MQAQAPDQGPSGRRGLTSTVVRGVVLAGSGFALTQVLTLGAYLVLARTATPADFGELAAGGILLSIGLLFTDSGMLAAVVQRRDRVEEAAATAVLSTLAAGVGFSLLALAASPLIGAVFHSDTIAKVAAALSGLLILRSIPIVPTALLQRRFSFLRRIVVEPLGVIAFGAVAIVGTSEGMGVWGLVLGNYAQAVTDIVLSWGLARWRPRLGLASRQMWRELIAYGRYVFSATALLHVASQLPVALIGRFVGTAPLGQYRYADRIATTPFGAALAAGAYVIFPAFARISHDEQRFRSAFVRAMRWMATLGIPLGLILLPLGEPIAVLVFGETWREAGQAAMALCLYPAAGVIFAIVSEAFTADRSDLLMRQCAFQLVVGLVVIAALTPAGLVGICVGISVAHVIGAAYSLWLADRELGFGLRELVREILPALGAALIMALAVLALEQLVFEAADRSQGAGLALLAAEVVLAGVLYVAALHLLAPGRVREFRSLAGRVTRRGDGAEETDPETRTVEDSLRP